MLIDKQILYEHNLEDDHIVIAQTAILLSFYNSNSDAMSNSTWLSVAVEHAQAVNALEYDYIEPRFNREQLKRLWCCCILRDRVISLGMRRPLQILPEKFPVTENLMCLDDLKEELGNSKTYNLETKTMLNFMFIGLCEFAEAVTDLLLILYPPHQRSPWVTTDRHGTIWEHLTRIKLRLSVWEGDFMRRLEHDECEIHPSITLFVSMIDMYYQAARIALCNHACRLAAKFESLQSKKLILESYKSELQNAVTDMADSVRRLIVADMAKYLPVSAMACTMLPLILCGLDVSLPSSARTPRRNSQKLLIFKEINRIYSLRYNVKRLSLLIELAIEFVKSEIIKIMLGAKEVVISFADMFEREPDSYVGLCLYVDRLLAVDDLGTQINANKPNRAQQQHQKQLLDLHHYIKSEQPCLAPTSYATTSSSHDSDECDSTIEDPSQIIPFASAMYSSASPSFSSPEYMGITVTEQIDTTPMCWASEDQNILKEHSLEQSQGQTLGGAWSDQYFETIGFLGE
ncbi:hypothetical protein BGW36DRAFT_427482 [Talaromyces proteolyticus]|uniref:Xylanolytic transcriptional activator regulatory domain-containing protein n=1 Tax=Talaromyces proteolyticus TaxID=1131652 RepID=A0AAD4KWD4_9EURO|nr:uncharacterized protein BGW36DRAFT_427482 [Talaromyces proteolyticus]KAH8697524.1 hypothetical protein BGW36DRAFT_427482 [Talaromyces proteolyticus]